MTREIKVLSCESLPAGVVLIAQPEQNGWTQIVKVGMGPIWVRRWPGEVTLTSVATASGIETTIGFLDRIETSTTRPVDA